MKPVTKTFASVNQTAAIDPERVKHLGKNYATLDFEITLANPRKHNP